MSDVEKVAFGVEIVLFRRVMIVWRSDVGVLLSLEYTMRTPLTVRRPR